MRPPKDNDIVNDSKTRAAPLHYFHSSNYQLRQIHAYTGAHHEGSGLHPETYTERHTSFYILSRYQSSRYRPIGDGIGASRMGDEQKYGGGGYGHLRG